MDIDMDMDIEMDIDISGTFTCQALLLSVWTEASGGPPRLRSSFHQRQASEVVSTLQGREQKGQATLRRSDLHLHPCFGE